MIHLNIRFKNLICQWMWTFLILLLYVEPNISDKNTFVYIIAV